VDIPDPALRKIVGVIVGVWPDHPVTCDAIQRLTSITNPLFGVKSLEGLQYATNLELLDLQENEVTDLSPLAHLPRLRILRLRQNDLTTLHGLGELPALEVLQVDQNRLRDISALATQTTLTTLRMNRNDVTSLAPLASLTRLRVLEAFRNPLTSLAPVRGLPELQVLYAGDRSLSPGVLAIAAHLRNLTRLGLSFAAGAPVDLTPLTPLRSLTELQLRGAPLVHLGVVAGLQNLTRLDLVDAGVSDVRPFTALPRLRQINLSHNAIRDISPLQQADSLGVHDQVDLTFNCLDLNDPVTKATITSLRARGVYVMTDHQRSDCSSE
jgi:internalin A